MDGAMRVWADLSGQPRQMGHLSHHISMRFGYAYNKCSLAKYTCDDRK